MIEPKSLHHIISTLWSMKTVAAMPRHRQQNLDRGTSVIAIQLHTAASRCPFHPARHSHNCSWGPQVQAQRMLGGSYWDTMKNPGMAGACLLHVCVCVGLPPRPRQADDEDDPHSWFCGQYGEWLQCPATSFAAEMTTRTFPAGAWMSMARDQEGAVEEVIARPLGIQPSINKHVWPLLQLGQLLGLMQL
jgi:hypothetical protein